MRPCWLAFTRRSRPLDGAPNPSCFSVSFPSSSAALGALVGACHQVVRGPPHPPPPRRCVVSSSSWESCPPGLSPKHMSCSRARCSHRHVGLPPGAVPVPAYALDGTSRTRVASSLGLLRRRRQCSNQRFRRIITPGEFFQGLCDRVFWAAGLVDAV